MTACADRAAPRRGSTASKGKSLAAFIAGVIAFLPTPAAAGQIGAVVSIFSDERFRGVSVSDGRPVATLDLSYDAPHGLYGSLSGTLVATRDEGPRALSAIVNAGYAKQLRSGLIADVGIYHTRYTHYSGLSSGRSFTEVYAGLMGKAFGGRISVSPNYLGVARWTAHGEVDGHLDLSRNTFVEGEAGLLVPLSKSAYQEHIHSQFDARLGLARREGPVTFHASVSARTGADAVYGGHGHDRVGLVLGLSTAL